MHFIYIYSPSDFVGGLPDESGAQAAGSPTFTLQLLPGATPTLVQITDDDTVFDEVDASQSLTNAVNLGGTNFAAGTTINTAYDLINTGTGHKVTSFHFGGDGFQQGAVDGLASTVPLTPGVAYTFNTERTSHQQNNQYSDFVACFEAQTPIDTENSSIPAGQLVAGDVILTRDDGPQPILGVLSQIVPARGALAPIVFPAGALGNQVQISVSPQHRMLISGPRAELLFGDREVLVPAVFLAEQGVGYRKVGGMVRYVHLLMEQHQILSSSGCLSESFLLSDQTHLPPALRQEIETIFPTETIAANRASRLCLRRFEAMALSA
ncbi:MAG: Hint domain-containing protein [Sulfitobacter sp.]